MSSKVVIIDSMNGLADVYRNDLAVIQRRRGIDGEDGARS